MKTFKSHFPIPETVSNLNIVCETLKRKISPPVILKNLSYKRTIEVHEPSTSISSAEITEDKKSENSFDIFLPDLSDEESIQENLDETDIPGSNNCSISDEINFAIPHTLPKMAPPKLATLPKSKAIDESNSRSGLLESIRSLGGLKGANLKSPKQNMERRNSLPSIPKSGNTLDFMSSLTNKLSARRSAIEPIVSREKFVHVDKLQN